jgi:hypothetical protein
MAENSISTSGWKGLLALVAFGLAVLACYLAWPISGILIFAFVLFAACAGSTKPWAAGLVSMLRPILIGLSLVVVLTILLNFLSPEVYEEQIRDGERVLLRVAHAFPGWTKLSSGKGVTLFVCLTAISYFVPRLALIRKFQRAQKYAGVASATLATLTSFTFFSEVALDRKEQLISDKLTVKFRDSKARQEQLISRYLALEAVARAIPRATPESPQFCKAVLETIASHSQEPKRSAIDAGILLANESSGPKEPQSDVAPIHTPEELNAQLQREKKAQQQVSDAEEGVKKIISEAMEPGSELLQEMSFALLEPLLNLLQEDAAKQLKTYLRKLSDKYLDAVTEPVVERLAARAIDRLNGIVARFSRFSQNMHTNAALMALDVHWRAANAHIRMAEVAIGVTNSEFGVFDLGGEFVKRAAAHEAAAKDAVKTALAIAQDIQSDASTTGDGLVPDLVLKLDNIRLEMEQAERKLHETEEHAREAVRKTAERAKEVERAVEYARVRARVP